MDNHLHRSKIESLITNEWSKSSSDVETTRKMHEFYVACSRRIVRLLPHEESRRGVESAEDYLAGIATWEELSDQNWLAEGAAFTFDFNSEPERISKWVAEIESIPKEEMRKLLNGHYSETCFDAANVLQRAAYFAEGAMLFPSFSNKTSPRALDAAFLSIDVFEQVFRFTR